MNVDNSRIHITECPRDAMQGIQEFVPTELKVSYLNALLDCGFSRLDFGSFVSSKAIPQLIDTSEVVLQLKDSPTKLLAIIANERGVEHALQYNRISFLGYPFSVSEQFQLRNTQVGIEDSKIRLKNIAHLIKEGDKNLLVYLSMGFGNPYGDPWSVSMVVEYAKELYETLGIEHFALADTIGCATPDQLSALFKEVKKELPQIEIGVHLHALPNHSWSLIQAAIDSGCTHFDSAILGMGGCPMAKDDLTGNLATETLHSYATNLDIETGVNNEAFNNAKIMADAIFNRYH